MKYLPLQCSGYLRFKFFKESSNHQWLADNPSTLPAVAMASSTRSPAATAIQEYANMMLHTPGLLEGGGLK